MRIVEQHLRMKIQMTTEKRMVTHTSKKYENLNGIQGKDIVLKLETLYLQKFFQNKNCRSKSLHEKLRRRKKEYF